MRRQVYRARVERNIDRHVALRAVAAGEAGDRVGGTCRDGGMGLARVLGGQQLPPARPRNRVPLAGFGNGRNLLSDRSLALLLAEDRAREQPRPGLGRVFLLGAALPDGPSAAFLGVGSLVARRAPIAPPIVVLTKQEAGSGTPDPASASRFKRS